MSKRDFAKLKRTERAKDALREMQELKDLGKLLDQYHKDPEAYRRRLAVEKRLAKAYRSQFK